MTSDSTNSGNVLPSPGKSGNATSTTARGGALYSVHSLTMTPRSFALLAALLLVLLLSVQALVVVAVSYSQTTEAPGRSLDRGWALLSLSAIAWAVVNVYWSNRATKSPNTDGRTTAVLGHLAIAIGCGLIAMGIHAVSVSRMMVNEPLVLDYSKQGRTNQVAEVIAPQVIAGDAEEGRKFFSTTCITCHGPSGDGLPNLAPSLRGSPFVVSADDGAIANVIRLGRAATDPANKSKKVMPARGGNPFLSDDKIAHLVAFVRAIQTEVPSAPATDPDAPPPVLLSDWVLPDAAPAPTGLVALANMRDLGDDQTLQRRDQDRKAAWVQTLTFCMMGLHGLFVLGVMVMSTHVLVLGLQDEPLSSDRSWWTWSSLGWVVAGMVGLAVFLFGFVMV